MKNKSLFSDIFVIITATLYLFPASAAGTEFSYKSGGQDYRYSVVAAGENFNFEFDANPGNNNEQLRAGVHILRSIFQDSSVNLEKRQNYIRERAKCSLFEGNMYNYTFCVFPNDFSPNKQEKFRGFVTQVPNWKWMVIWNLLPVLLVFGMVFFFTRKR